MVFSVYEIWLISYPLVNVAMLVYTSQVCFFEVLNVVVLLHTTCSIKISEASGVIFTHWLYIEMDKSVLILQKKKKLEVV